MPMSSAKSRASGWRLATVRAVTAPLAGVVLLEQDLNVVPGAIDGGLASLGTDPRQHESPRSSLDLGHTWRWDVAVRRVGERPDPPVPSSTAADSRLVWQPTPALEIAFAVQNLLDPSRAAWGVAANRVEIERSCFVRVRLQR
jgi:iron complex outermembrane recepter protein